MKYNGYKVISEAMTINEDIQLLEESSLIFVQENLDSIKKLAGRIKNDINIKSGAKFLKKTKSIGSKGEKNIANTEKKLIKEIADKTDTQPKELESTLLRLFRGVISATGVPGRVTLGNLNFISILLLIMAYVKYKKRSDVLNQKEDFLKFLTAYVLESSLYKQAKKGSMSHDLAKKLLLSMLLILTIVGIPAAIVYLILVIRLQFQIVIAKSLGYDPSTLTPKEYNEIKTALDNGKIPDKKPESNK